MLRLLGFLVTTAIGIGGFMAIDYNMSREGTNPEDADGLTFTEYLGSFSQRFTAATGSPDGQDLPTALADMMPRPPEGWTVRPTTPEDVQPFLPRRAETAPPEARALLDGIVAPAGPKGAETVTLTYERGNRRVVVKAIRYPDVIFTSVAAMAQRFELQTLSATYFGSPFMTVRGLDVTEDVLPPELRGRLFLADVGAQIHLRVLAPDRLSDEDLVPFFATLHVKAMNASVVDKQEGLGEVPVIVLASAMAETERQAYEADRAAREAEAKARAEAARQAAAAEAAAEGPAEGTGGGAEAAPPASPDTGFSADCTADAAGNKRCTVGGN